MADYIKQTGNHVLYRATPVFWENELVALGIIGMAILSFSGYSAMSKAGDDLDNMYQRKLKATRLLGNEINYTRKVQLGVTKHIIDPKDEQIVAYVKEALESYEKTWPRYKELAIRADK